MCVSALSDLRVGKVTSRMHFADREGSEPKYNDAIKEVFRLAGINRVVTVLDPTTRREVRMPISECASSHMARRTFCGNLYKRVKAPNIVASMSGHKEGSKAFARYREIDKDIKRDALKVFEAI